MALVANTWYQVAFTAPSVANAPPWDVATQISIPGEITTAIITGATMYVFCVSAGATATIAILGNGSVQMTDAVMTVVATPAMDISTGPNGTTWYSIRDGVAWYWYDFITGQVSYIADSTVLGAFIS